MNTIPEMIHLLKFNPLVVGLIEYGSPQESKEPGTGDYDLFVILKEKAYEVEGLHFYVDTVPVDLNLRTLDDIKNAEFLEGFETVLLEGRILYDPTGDVERELEDLKIRQRQRNQPALSEHAVVFMRHGHKHLLDKARGRMETRPVLCELLLNTNIYWLVQNYFAVRRLPFKGEQYMLQYLEEHEPEIYQYIQEFYNTTNLPQRFKISKALTDLVLEPVGGPWKNDELLAFGDDTIENLQQQGKKQFQLLFR
jgi:hypothetical protein